MNEKKVIDVHCHLFNGGYALAELTAASWNLLKGTYPYKSREVLGLSRSFERLEGIKNFAAYVARLLDVVFLDEEGNYETQKNSLVNSGLSQKNLISVPLMMDIYYALDDNGAGRPRSVEDLASLEVSQPLNIETDEESTFEQHLDQVRNLVAEELAALPKRRDLSLERAGGPEELLNLEIEKIRKKYLGIHEVTPRSGYPGIELSPGFQSHMEALEDLASNHPNQVIPFLAVDPRRPGIQRLMEMKLDKGQGLFKGIKLYPPQGYLPTHPNLEAVYTYCSQYDIPITVHCSLGGFGNLRRKNWVESWDADPHWETFNSHQTKSQYYANPENWIPVMERFNNLRINFGHFGGSQAKKASTIHDEWVNTILQLMEKYPNVYADLSYVADRERQRKTMELIRKHEILQQRVMFGTDFIMVAMDPNLGGLTQYFTNYSDLKENLLYHNASRFLKLDDLC